MSSQVGGHIDSQRVQLLTGAARLRASRASKRQESAILARVARLRAARRAEAQERP